MNLLKIFAVIFLISGYTIAQQQPIPPQQGPEPDMGLIPTQNLTYKNFPTPEEVLVVYARNIDSSSYVAQYYASVRNIPDENIIPEGLFIPSSITYQEGIATLQAGGEDIWGLGNLGWRYVIDTIATPIQRYLNNTYVNGQPLKNRINYIVLMKGIPLKVRSLP